MSIALYDLGNVSARELVRAAHAVRALLGDFAPFVAHASSGLVWRHYVVNAPAGFAECPVAVLGPRVELALRPGEGMLLALSMYSDE